MDNVLERFIVANREDRLVSDEQLLRVATDVGKVSKDLQEYTINARVGGDMNENNKLFKEAQRRVKAARVRKLLHRAMSVRLMNLLSDCIHYLRWFRSWNSPQVRF